MHPSVNPLVTGVFKELRMPENQLKNVSAHFWKRFKLTLHCRTAQKSYFAWFILWKLNIFHSIPTNSSDQWYFVPCLPRLLCRESRFTMRCRCDRLFWRQAGSASEQSADACWNHTARGSLSSGSWNKCQSSLLAGENPSFPRLGVLCSFLLFQKIFISLLTFYSWSPPIIISI